MNPIKDANSSLFAISSFTASKFSDKKRYQFFNELGILIESGLDLKTSLEIILESDWKQKELQNLQLIIKKVISGKDLWEAVKESNCFESYEFFSIQIGESTGRLGQILKDLGDFIKRRMDQRKKLTSAITYPGFILFVAIMSVVFMMKFVVPMFKGVFERFGAELPYVTKLVITVSEGVNRWFLFIVGIIIAFVLANYFLKREEWYQKRSTNFILRIPYFGDLVKKVQLAKFFLAFEILSTAKVSILTSLELLEKMFDFYPLKTAIAQIRLQLINGTPIYIAFSKHTIFDKKAVALIRVGEEVNQLDLVLKTLREQYSQEVDFKMSMIGSFLEPLLIVFLGGVVGLILISMYLPLFKLSTSFQF
jgi:type IV pilus assembly protein PilC